jgi:glyoxylate utilization-related uncharacterized protein
MTKTNYAPHGGYPPYTDLLTGCAIFTEAYAVIPKGVMRGIVNFESGGFRYLLYKDADRHPKPRGPWSRARDLLVA